MVFPRGLHCLLRLKQYSAGCRLVSIRLWGLPFLFGIWHKGFFGYMHRSRLANYLILNLWLSFYQKVYFIFWVLQRTVSLGSFWVCTVWTPTRSGLISACSICLHIFGNHTFFSGAGTISFVKYFTCICYFYVNYIFQTVWTQVRLLRSSLISVHSVCIRDILYIYSAVSFRIIKTALFC